MHWNDTGEKTAEPAELADEYYDEAQYSPFKRESLGDTFSRVLLRSGSPLLIILAAVAVLLLLVVLFLPGKGTVTSGTSGSDLAVLETRVAQLEARISRLEGAIEKQDQTKSQDPKYNQLKERIDSLEASLSHRMDRLSQEAKEVLAQERQAASRATAPAGASRAPARKENPRVALKKNASSTRYHTVRKGDTLYSISRKNGLSVEELRTLNHLHTGETIRPGQRLLLTR
jgi:LysM repeat protein